MTGISSQERHKQRNEALCQQGTFRKHLALSVPVACGVWGGGQTLKVTVHREQQATGGSWVYGPCLLWEKVSPAQGRGGRSLTGRKHRIQEADSPWVSEWVSEGPKWWELEMRSSGRWVWGLLGMPRCPGRNWAERCWFLKYRKSFD